MHLHRLGERCRCGHLTVPCRFYWENGKELSQEKAEQAYLEHLKEHMPGRYEKLAIHEEPTKEKPHATNAPKRLRGRKEIHVT